MADIIIVGPTSTVPLQANTPVQLVTASSGKTNLFVSNPGPGNLYARYDAYPSAGDLSSYELPPNKTVSFPIYGNDGIFVLSDQAGNVSIRNMPNPIPSPARGVTVPLSGGGQNQSPWLSNINAAGFSLLNVNNISGTGTISTSGPISTTGQISASIVTATSVGIGTTTPAYSLDVVGDINITGTYRVNGTPFAPPGVALVQSAVPPTTMPNGSLWFDSASLVLYMLFNGAWIGV